MARHHIRVLILSRPLKDRPAPHFDFVAIIIFVIARSKCGDHDNSPLTPLHVPPVILLVASLLWFGFCPSDSVATISGVDVAGLARAR
jgi:hypothetical protein